MIKEIEEEKDCSPLMRLKDIATKSLSSTAQNQPLINKSFQEIHKSNFHKIEIKSFSSNSDRILPVLEEKDKQNFSALVQE